MWKTTNFWQYIIRYPSSRNKDYVQLREMNGFKGRTWLAGNEMRSLCLFKNIFQHKSFPFLSFTQNENRKQFLGQSLITIFSL